MVKIAVLLNPDGEPLGLTCRGHANFGEGGPDLVCAAVSALTGALGIAFSEVIQLPVQLSGARGEFSLLLQPDATTHPEWPSARTLLRTTWLALEQLASTNRGFLQLRTRSAQGDSTTPTKASRRKTPAAGTRPTEKQARRHPKESDK